MTDLVIRANEGCDPDPYLLWDSRWSPNDGLADFALAGAAEKLNRGGLSAKAGIATAVVLALFTDKRIASDHPLYWLADGDPRGYWGDGIDVRADLGETQLGSYLWLLERAPLTISGQSAAVWAQQFALEALQPLKDQGAVARIDASATADEINDRLELIVNLYGEDGQAIYSQKFAVLWRQVQAAS